MTEEDIDDKKVGIGSRVVLHDYEYKEDVEYIIVGTTEANSRLNKISNESLVGAAIMGKKVGKTVTIDTLAGKAKYKIVKITKS